MSTFTIGSQNAGSIQNVGGDMVLYGGLHATVNGPVGELRGRLADLAQEIDGVALSTESRALVRGALAEAMAEACAPAPRSPRIAQCLKRVTATLEDAGGLANAAVGVGRALAGVASLVALLV